MKTCQRCGRSFEAKRSDAKFCGATCRSRNHVAPVELPVSKVPSPSLVVDATRSELAEVGRESSALGLAALALARKLDEGRDSAAGLASVAKQLELTLASAKRGAGAASAPQQLRDELADRRAAHGA